jgi:chromosome segregation ATPase
MSKTATAESSTQAAQNSNVPSVVLKRQVTVKTLVTDSFRERAKGELANELRLIDTQLQQLEAQYQHSLQQLEKVAQQGQNVQKQLQGLDQEAQQKRTQLASLKMQVSSELGNLDKVENGSYVITGILENMVEIRVGDNVYEKLMNAEMVVEDGIVKSISSL